MIGLLAFVLMAMTAVLVVHEVVPQTGHRPARRVRERERDGERARRERPGVPQTEAFGVPRESPDPYRFIQTEVVLPPKRAQRVFALARLSGGIVLAGIVVGSAVAGMAGLLLMAIRHVAGG